eukprot:1567946-Alexandrium_andersonii.AAC.1
MLAYASYGFRLMPSCCDLKADDSEVRLHGASRRQGTQHCGLATWLEGGGLRRNTPWYGSSVNTHNDDVMVWAQSCRN